MAYGNEFADFQIGQTVVFVGQNNAIFGREFRIVEFQHGGEAWTNQDEIDAEGIALGPNTQAVIDRPGSNSPLAVPLRDLDFVEYE